MNDYARGSLKSDLRILVIGCFVVASAGIGAPSGIAQTNATPVSTSPPEETAPRNKTLAFDVVSIRPSKGNSGHGFQIAADGYRASDTTLFTTIMMAYFPFPLWSNERLKGAPSWVTEDPYDIVAKVAPEDLAEWQKHQQNLMEKPMLATMLQATLAERCKLVVHRIPAEVPGLVLTIGKKGTTLKPAKAGESVPEDGMALLDGGKAVFTGKNGEVEWTFHHASIGSLIVFLQLGSRTVIEDKTGLTDKYDFVLRRQEPVSPSAAQNDIPAPGPSAPWDFEGLGLRLTGAKIPTETLVVDHIERPSEN